MKKEIRVPDDCGYNKSFEHDIPLGDYGVDGECIDWCALNCKKKWGWHFDAKADYNEWLHNYEEQQAYMSFESREDAFRFWFECSKYFGNPKYNIEW
jgi:hypothetical protein